MKSWLRRLRGILGIGTLWGVAGTVLIPTIGIVLRVVLGGASLGSYLSQSLLPSALFGAVGGFILGSGFAGVLTVIERRRTLEELSTARTVVYAGLIGAALTLAYGLVLFGPDRFIYLFTIMPVRMASFPAVYGALGGALAAGTVSLAKRAPPELEPGNADLLDAPRDSVTAIQP